MDNAPNGTKAEAKIDDDGTLTLALQKPVEFAKATVESLKLRFNAGALRGFSIEMKADGSIVYEPHRLAELGIKLCGQSSPLLGHLSREDFHALAQAAMLFVI